MTNLEQRLGPRLDGLDAEEREFLIGELEFRRQFVRRRWFPGEPARGLIREILLDALDRFSVGANP